MTFYEDFLTFFILFVLLIIGYLKYTNKTLPEFVREIKETFSDSAEELEGGIK